MSTFHDNGSLHSMDMIPTRFQLNAHQDTQSSVTIDDMLSNQNDIVRALVYMPRILVNYIHHEGSAVQFRGADVKIPPLPLIVNNDPSICCFLDKINRSNGSNQSCANLTINPLGPKGETSVPYIIKDHVGNTMMVKFNKIKKLHAAYHNSPPTALDHFEDDGKQVDQCISHIKLTNIHYIGSDEFTNETLIAYVLNYMLTIKPLPVLFVQHYQGIVCSNKATGQFIGINIMENCDLGTLNKLSEHPMFQEHVQQYNIEYNNTQLSIRLIHPETIRQIFTQVIVSLHMLQTYVSFTSGDMKAANIFVKSDEINTEYLGIKLKAPFTCKISDYGKSSCMLHKTNAYVRFYNETTAANVYLAFHPFTHDIFEDLGEYFFTTNYVFNSQLYTRIRHMGIPYYYSFDYYTLLVSILTNPVFFYMFFSTESLRRTFWDPVWKDDGDEAIKRIYQYILNKKSDGINDAINILRGLKMRCNAVQLVIDEILASQ